MTQNPTAAILVIGDEILSGRTREGNAHYLAGVLSATGFDLREIRVIPDDMDSIIAAIRHFDRSLGGSVDHLFTSGGIGPTHDDLTADAVAAAFGTVLEIHPEARRVMEERYTRIGLEMTENRLRMARIPVGATLIDNPVSSAPGFSIGVTHVMAGVPEVFRSMVESVIPTLPAGRPSHSETLEVLRGESDVAEVLGACARDWPDLAMGSYPFTYGGGDTKRGYGTNLVIRGLDADRVAAAMADLRSRIGAL
ncbi:MAG: molybdopterin-binding protein [Paracoccus sp. (in: a-proteobacteria)]|uniref:competence/damage-inducible protein A n=1 Tax=Paracoccus sp. TaxID=267 RepID=UPI0026E01198|nr:molybdopterin-binding protein [Paracoccus sp. (in: a-proteobacteria)]MDO5621171.1 molybdopterin-binding protein [Paracoccus sp. (in: a-proteobacteria)]